MTLRGEGIAREFQQMVENYIEKRFGVSGLIGERLPAPAPPATGRPGPWHEKLTAVKGMNDIAPPRVRALGVA